MSVETMPRTQERIRFDESYLQSLSAERLKKINRLWGGKSNETKAACIRRIRRGLGNPSAIRVVVESLKPIDRAALAIVKENGGVISADELELILRANGYDVPEDKGHRFGRSISDFVDSLVDKGVLLEVSYYDDTVFSDERILGQIDLPVKVHPLPLSPTHSEARSTFRRPSHVIMDCLAVTRVLGELGQLHLTKSGYIRAADIRKFSKAMDWEKEPSFDGYDYPDLVKGVISAWCNLGWLVSDDEALYPAIEPETFMKRSLREHVRMLTGGFLQGINPITGLSERNWREADRNNLRSAVLYSLRTLPDATHFYTVNDYVAALYNRIGTAVESNPTYNSRPWKSPGMSKADFEEELLRWKETHSADWIQRETIFVGEFFTTWPYWLGLIELRDEPNLKLAFRLTDLGRSIFARNLEDRRSGSALPSEAGPAWVVQPNYEIVVYLDAVSAEQLVFLEQHTERSQADAHIAQYQLTRESVHRGLENGASIEEVIETLQAGAKTDLPKNVERELTEWADRREQIAVYTKSRVIAFPSTKARDTAIQAGLKGKAVGELFVLAPTDEPIKTALHGVFWKKPAPILSIDYTDPPLRCLRLQEDGVITVVRNPKNLLIREQLHRFAKQVDERHWVMTRESLKEMRKAGVSATMFLTWLQDRATDDIPPLLELVIRGALGSRSKVQGGTAFVCYITDKKLYEAVVSSPTLSSYLADVPGPDTVVVDPEHVAEFKAALGNVGVKFTDYAPFEERPDWLQAAKDAKVQQRRRER